MALWRSLLAGWLLACVSGSLCVPDAFACSMQSSTRLVPCHCPHDETPDTDDDGQALTAAGCCQQVSADNGSVPVVQPHKVAATPLAMPILVVRFTPAAPSTRVMPTASPRVPTPPLRPPPTQHVRLQI